MGSGDSQLTSNWPTEPVVWRIDLPYLADTPHEVAIPGFEPVMDRMEASIDMCI